MASLVYSVSSNNWSILCTTLCVHILCLSWTPCVLVYLQVKSTLCDDVPGQSWPPEQSWVCVCVLQYLTKPENSVCSSTWTILCTLCFFWTWPVLCTECLGTWPVLSNLSVVVVVVYAQSYALCVFLYLASPMHRVFKLLVQSWAPGVFLHLSSLVHLLCLPITGQSCAPALSQKMNSPVHMVCSYTYPVPCIWCVLVPA